MNEQKCKDILKYSYSLTLKQLRHFVAFVAEMSDLSLYTSKDCHRVLMNYLQWANDNQRALTA